MRFVIRLLVSVSVIILCAQVGRRLPTLAGLIAVMPLTGLIVLLWLYSDNPGDFDLLSNYTRGVLWGIGPTILFFAVAFFCFRKQFPLWLVLSASFTVWLMGAFIHQWLLRE